MKNLLCLQTLIFFSRQLFEIYESLSTPTVEKINSVVYSAINLCTVVYASVGFLGYVAYCKGGFTGNILLSFTPSFSSEMFKLGFVMSIAVSFPLVIFPCRASLYSLIFKRVCKIFYYNFFMFMSSVIFKLNFCFELHSF